jgi:hypothetical protein
MMTTTTTIPEVVKIIPMTIGEVYNQTYVLILAFWDEACRFLRLYSLALYSQALTHLSCRFFFLSFSLFIFTCFVTPLHPINKTITTAMWS